MNQVANAIISCRRTFLDEQKWKEVPWEDDPSTKSLFEHLIDVFSDIPYFLQEIANANISTTVSWPKRPDKDILQKELLRRLETLRELRKAWHMKYTTPMWTVPVASASSPDPDSIKPPFDAAIYFTNMLRAYEFCTLQMTCILLVLLYQELSPENLQPVEDALPDLFPNGAIEDLARNICRCTEFLCLDQNGSRGYIVLQLPATIAYLAIDPNAPEAKWLYSVCKKRARSSGFGWGHFAMDQVTPLSIWLASCRDRRRSSASSGRFPVGRPCRLPDSKERALVIVNASAQSEAALPMRGKDQKRPCGTLPESL